ncbi:MAG: hypothetical protein ACRDGM_08480 [bacterium]
MIYNPSRIQKLAQFSAADPWNDNRPTTFVLDRCFDGGYVQDYTVLEDESLPQKYAIKSELEPDHRVLPDSLAWLWRSGKIPTERLPALLKGLEPNLGRSDFIGLLTMNRVQRGVRTYAPQVLGVFVFLLGAALLLVPDLATSVVMMAIGILVIALTRGIVGRLNARRKRQMDWALSQPGG